MTSFLIICEVITLKTPDPSPYCLEVLELQIVIQNALQIEAIGMEAPGIQVPKNVLKMSMDLELIHYFTVILTGCYKSFN